MRTAAASFAIVALLADLAAAASFDCKKIRAQDVEFRLDALGGPKYISWVRDHGSAAVFNTTFAIDLCKSLPLDKDAKKGERCPQGTRICGTERVLQSDHTEVTGIIPIMRQYEHDGARFDAEFSLLRNSDSNADSQREGLRLTVGGGVYGADKKKQRAHIEFLCERPEEGDQASERELNGRGPAAEEEDTDKSGDDNKDGDNEDDGDDKATNPDWEKQKSTPDGAGGRIVFQSYDDTEKEGVLRLNWYTKYGCEDSATGEPAKKPEEGRKSGGGWGFFSWFFFILFMGVLAYLVFAAWLNYSQHGARGWELLPHSDTLRDIPYILADWGRKIIGTFSGGGSRGGYSAV